MTDFNKVQDYYKNFNEKDRLVNDNSGKLEYEMTMKILMENLPTNAKILDLGGAAGIYTFPLSKIGYEMYLADLSVDLINEAKEIKENGKYENVKSCDVVNAIDLGIYADDQFDVILMFGPLYHLLDIEEREKCISEVCRVLKKGGLVFASFIPYLSGSIAIIDRYFRHSEQVNVSNLREVFRSGKFNNASSNGFQEGYYPTSDEIEKLFQENNFEKVDILSIRGFGYEKEDKLYSITDKAVFDEILKLISETAKYKELVETCGHAMYIGRLK